MATLNHLLRVFLSTYPVRGTTAAILARNTNKHDISIHVPRAGYDRTYTNRYETYQGISIHVPRAGYDEGVIHTLTLSPNFYPRTPCGVRRVRGVRGQRSEQISIHVPRAGYDKEPLEISLTYKVFLSTYPVRGTTVDAVDVLDAVFISIHVPRAGYDYTFEPDIR